MSDQDKIPLNEGYVPVNKGYDAKPTAAVVKPPTAGGTGETRVPVNQPQKPKD